MTTVIQKEVRMIFILKKMLSRTTLVMRRESLYEHLWVQSWHVSDWVKICWLNFSEILHEYCHLRFRKIDCLSFFGKMFATAQVRVFWSMELCFFYPYNLYKFWEDWYLFHISYFLFYCFVFRDSFSIRGSIVTL